MFTLRLMVKGQGALVGATYGLLVRAETGDTKRLRSLSLSLTGGRRSACAFMTDTQDEKQNGGESSSQSTDCVPDAQQALKANCSREWLKKRNVRQEVSSKAMI